VPFPLLFDLKQAGLLLTLMVILNFFCIFAPTIYYQQRYFKKMRKQQANGAKRLLLSLTAILTCVAASSQTFVARSVEGVDVVYKVTNPERHEVQVGTGTNTPAINSAYEGKLTIPPMVNHNQMYMVTSVADNAFYLCAGLTEVNLQGMGLEKIGERSFLGCKGLLSITIPEGVKSIGRFAFCNCSELMSVTLPSSLDSIARSAFMSCDRLKSVTCYPPTAPKLEGTVFPASAIKEATLVLIPDDLDQYKSLAPWNEFAKIDTVSVEEPAEFPGGMGKILEYIARNVKYPVKAQEQGISGRCIVEYTIDTDGSVTDVNVVQSLSPECDEEALRVVKAMPKWKPAKRNRKLVRIKGKIPINFTLSPAMPRTVNIRR